MVEGEASPQKHSRTRNYVAGLFSGYVLTFATIVVGLWLTPFTLSFLDREEYAIFMLAGDMLMWLGLLDLGITAGLRVQAAQLTGHPDQDRLNRLASTGFFTQNLVVIAVLAIGAGVAFVFPHFFPVRPDLQNDATMMLILMVLGLAMSVGTQTFSALLVANQQIHVDNAIGFLNIVIRTVLTVVLLKAGWGMYSLAAANLAAKGTSASLAVARTYRLIPGLQIRRKFASWETLKGIGHLGIWFSLGGLAGIISGALDRVMTAKIISVDMVTTLTLTGRLYSLSNILLSQITDTARPMLGQLFGQKKMGDVLRVYRHLFALSTGSAMIAAACMWAGNGSFVTRWVGGANYGGTALDVALAVNLVVFVWILPNRAVLSANLAVRPQVLVRLLEGIVSLGLAILLGKMYGLIGIVVATGLASLATSIWLLPLLTARMFERPFMRFLWDDASRVLALLVCLVPVALVARYVAVDISGYVGALIGAATAGTFGVVLLWFLVLDEPLRLHARQALAQFKRKVLVNVR